MHTNIYPRFIAQWLECIQYTFGYWSHMNFCLAVVLSGLVACSLTLVCHMHTLALLFSSRRSFFPPIDWPIFVYDRCSNIYFIFQYTTISTAFNVTLVAALVRCFCISRWWVWSSWLSTKNQIHLKHKHFSYLHSNSLLFCVCLVSVFFGFYWLIQMVRYFIDLFAGFS